MGCKPAHLNESLTDFDWAMQGVGVPADRGTPSKSMAAALSDAAVSRMLAHAGKS